MDSAVGDVMTTDVATVDEAAARRQAATRSRRGRPDPGYRRPPDPLRVFLRTDGDITEAVEHKIDVSTSAVNGTAAAASVPDGVVSPDNRTTWQIDDVLPPYIMWRTL